MTAASLPHPDTPLSAEAMQAAIDTMLAGKADDTSMALFLGSLATRGETAAEIEGAARALRAHMSPIEAPANAIDCCGTGGDGSHTLNISTAVAFVVAACGVPVAKHGNRASSSKCGAADVLEALGVSIAASRTQLERALANIGFCFLMAPAHHAAMRHVAPARKALGRRTIFNLIGPLANPARVSRQITGVPAPHWMAPVAQALQNLGTQYGFVLHGSGLDEVALHGPTEVTGWQNSTMPRTDNCWTPENFGLPTHPREAIAGGDAATNAAALTRLLDGERGAYHDVVCANAATALLMCGHVNSLPDGVRLASDAISSGRARAVLHHYRETVS